MSPDSDSHVHGILQARILEGLAMPTCKGLSQPRDRTQVSLIAVGSFIKKINYFIISLGTEMSLI